MMLERREDMEKQKYYSITEFAKIVGVHRTTVHMWVREKKIEYVTIGSRKFIPISQIERANKNGE